MNFEFLFLFLIKPLQKIIKFEINHIFLIESFCYMTKKARQKLKYLENEKTF